MWPFKRKKLPKYLIKQCPDYIEPSPWSLEQQIKKYNEMQRIKAKCREINERAVNFFPKCESSLPKVFADYLEELNRKEF